ncbi:hypothetical protein IFR05_001696 [Cadophora sp. M221]|nr:hypothetical protein IFR05_001696 [Cadophora sp. M221]
MPSSSKWKLRRSPAFGKLVASSPAPEEPGSLANFISVIPKIFETYDTVVDQLYRVGARNFDFTNLPESPDNHCCSCHWVKHGSGNSNPTD